MRTRLSLAAALLGTVALRPAAAQRAVAAHDRPAAAIGVDGAVDSADVVARPVAAYRFAGVRERGLPDQVTVADSGGALVATFRLPGATAARPMRVEVLDTDLVLQGDTPDGVLTIRLFGQNAGSATAGITGQWWLGAREGTLRGRVTP